MWFTDVLTPPGWPNAEFVDEDVPEAWVYDGIPPIDPDHMARTLNEALNRLHAEVWASQGVLELRGMINLTVPPREGVQYPGALLLPDGGGGQALGSASTSSPRTEKPHARSSRACRRTLGHDYATTLWRASVC